MMNFQKEVIDKSQDIPILVDFWAPWCGPCKYIGPILEELAEIQKEKWVLVKVNVDEHQDISRQYGIKGIPAIKLFHKGGIIADFGGAMPKPAVEEWLNENLPDPYREKLENLINNATKIPDAVLIDKLTKFIVENPDNDLAKITLANHLVFLTPLNAVEYIENIKLGNKYYDNAQHVRNISRFLVSDYQENPAVAGLMEEAKFDILENDFESGIQKIIDVNTIDKSYQNDLPRLTAIALFEILGKDHELTKTYRKKFDMVLY